MGKLVGAVTHVLLDDPQRGYGIFAENMLSRLRHDGAKRGERLTEDLTAGRCYPAVKFVLRVQKLERCRIKFVLNDKNLLENIVQM